MRPRNINLQDWRYTSFVDFIGYSQNIRRHNAMCRDELVADVVENIGLILNFKVDFQSIYFYIENIDFIIK